MPFQQMTMDFILLIYVMSKKSNELMAHSYSHLYSLLHWAVLVYGPWGRPDMAPVKLQGHNAR